MRVTGDSLGIVPQWNFEPAKRPWEALEADPLSYGPLLHRHPSDVAEISAFLRPKGAEEGSDEDHHGLC